MQDGKKEAGEAAWKLKIRALSLKQQGNWLRNTDLLSPAVWLPSP